MIRRMTEEDLKEAQRIILAAQKGVMYDLVPFLKMCLEQKADLSLVAEREGEIVGVVIGGLLSTVGMVDVLAVDSQTQGQGVGMELIEALSTRLRGRGASKLVVLSWEHSAPFYEKLGFREDPGIHFMSRRIEEPKAETRVDAPASVETQESVEVQR